MSFQQKLKHELKAMLLAALYFGCWIAVLLLIKELILAEYQIAFHHFSMALLGALVLSKVVLVLEHVPLGAWLRSRPAWVEVVLRTALYTVGVLILLLLEKAFEGRHEYGNFGASLAAVFHHTDIPHVWVNTIGMAGALLLYNAISVVRRHLGERALVRMYLTPLPTVSEAKTT